MLFDVIVIFFFQAEDGIRDLVRSRGLGDVYKRQLQEPLQARRHGKADAPGRPDLRIGVRPDRHPSGLSLIHI